MSVLSFKRLGVFAYFFRWSRAARTSAGVSFRALGIARRARQSAPSRSSAAVATSRSTRAHESASSSAVAGSSRRSRSWGTRRGPLSQSSRRGRRRGRTQLSRHRRPWTMLRGGESLEQRKVLATAACDIPEVTTLPNPLDDGFLNAVEAAVDLEIKVGLGSSGAVAGDKVTLSVDGVALPGLEQTLTPAEVSLGFVAFPVPGSTFTSGSYKLASMITDVADPSKKYTSDPLKSFEVDKDPPDTLQLTLGLGIANGASAAEATQSSGVITYQNAAIGNRVTFVFQGTIGQVVKFVENNTGSAPLVSLSGPDLVKLGDGAVTVTATQMDAAGNTSAPATILFTLDTVAPTPAVTLQLGAGINSTNGATQAEATQLSGVVTVTGETGATITVTFQNGSGRPLVKNVIGSGTTPVPVPLTTGDVGLLGDGTINVSATQTDVAGNLQIAAAATTSFLLDTTAPGIPSLALGNGVADGATQAEAAQPSGVVTVAGEIGAKITVTFQNGSGGPIIKTVTGSGATTPVPVTLTSAEVTSLGDGTINVSATQVDTAGNVGLPATLPSFLLDTTGPGTPSLTLGTGVTGGATQAEATQPSGVVTVIGELGAKIDVIFQRVGGGSVTKTVTGNGATPVPVVLTSSEVTTTLGDGTINVSATQTDAAGNAQTVPVSTTSFKLDAATPAAPGLSLGTGVATGATQAEAVQASGVVTVTGEIGATIEVRFWNGAGSPIIKTVPGNGATPVPVVLIAADVTALGDGTISVSATQTDAAGNTSPSESKSFPLDTTAPAAPMLYFGLGVGNGATRAEATQATGVVTVTGESGATITVTFRNGSGTPVVKPVTVTGSTPVAVVLTTAEVTSLGDGTIDVSATQVDAAGNVSSPATLPSFLLDTTAPGIPSLALGTGVVNGVTSAEATQLSGVVTVVGESGAAIVVTFTRGTVSIPKSLTGNGTSQPVVLTTADLAALGDGVVNVSAVQTDAVGNASSAGNTVFTLDTLPPAAPVVNLGTGVVNGASRAKAAQATGVVTVTGESGAKIDVTFQNGSGTPVVKTVTGNGTTAVPVVLTDAEVISLGVGTISVSATQTDAAGNPQIVPPFGTSFTLDNTPPLAPSLTLGTGVTNGANLAEATQASGVVTVIGEAGAAIVVTFTGGKGTVSKTLTGTNASQAVVLTATDAAALGDGLVTVTATQTDAAGNAQTAPPATVSFALDATIPSAPTLLLGTGITVTNGATFTEATQASGVVTVVGENNATIVVTFRDITGTIVTKTLTGTGASQPVVLTALEAAALGDGLVTVTATQTDAAGNAQTAPPATVSFTLDATIPSAPTLLLGTGVLGGATQAEATQASGVVTVTGETGAAITVTFQNGSGPLITKTVTGNGATPVAVPLLAADVLALGNGTVNVSATQKDTAGNAQTAPAATTSFILDTLVPVAPALALGAGVLDGATQSEATQASGVVTVTGESGAAINVTFQRVGGGSVTKNVTGTGSSQAVVLTAADLAILGNGVVTVSATQTDAAGNAQTALAATVSFTLDTVVPTAPTLVLGTGVNTGVASGATLAEATQASGVVTVTGEPGAAIVVTFRNGLGLPITKNLTGTGTSQPVELTPLDVASLTDGTIDVTARQTDAAGNAQTAPAATTSFVLRTVAPAAPSLTLGTGVANGATQAEATQTSGIILIHGVPLNNVITVVFTGTLAAVTKTIQSTGGTAQPITLTVADLAILGNGPVNISVTQTDVAGNPSLPSTNSFTLDTVAPAGPTLALGTGVANGATQAEATQASGVVTVIGESGAAILVTFTRGTAIVTKNLIGAGATPVPVVLTAADVSTLGDGAIAVAATQADAAGNASSPATNASFTLDTIAPTSPTLALGAGVANGATQAEATQASGVVTVVGELGAAIAVTFTRGAASVTKTVTGSGSSQAVVLTTGDLALLGDGTVNVSATQTDTVGNVQTAPVASTSFTLDSTPPAPPVLALGTGVATGATQAEATQATGVVTVIGEAGATIVVTFTRGTTSVNKTLTGNGAAQPVVLTSADLVTLGDGLINVSATQTDAAGGAQIAPAATASFTLDTIAPAAPTLALGTGVANGASRAEATQGSGVVTFGNSIVGDTVEVVFQGTSGMVTKRLTSTGGTAQPVVLDSVDLGVLGNGTVNVSATQTDAAGNRQTVAAATTSFLLDAEIPAVPVLALGSGVANGATQAEATQASGVVTVTGELGATIAVTFRNGSGTPITKNVTGNGATAVPVVLTPAEVGALGDGTISFSATQADAVGNTSSLTTTNSFTLDTNAPAAPALALGTGVANGATLAEATQAAGVVTVIGEVGAAISVTFRNGTGVPVTKSVTGNGATPVPVVLTSLDVISLGDGTVNVAATQTDAAGNTQTVPVSPESFLLDLRAPAAPSLALGAGIPNGATQTEATQASGVVTVIGEAGAAIVVTFTRGTVTVAKFLTGTGASQPVLLTTADLAVLGDGAISVSATQTDAAGNTQAAPAATVSFALDTMVPLAPVLALGTGVANGATQAEATRATGVVTVTGELGAAVTVTFQNGSGAPITKTLTGTGASQPVVLASDDVAALGDGIINVSATQTDAAGNPQTAPATIAAFTLDTAVPLAPVLALGTGVANGATQAEATQASGVVTVSGELGAAIAVTFRNGSGAPIVKNLTGTGASQPVELTSVDVAALGNGTVNVTATQTDAAGNVSLLATSSFTLDTVAPVAPVLALGTGVANGATQAEATQASGVVTVVGELGAAIAVTFTSGSASVTKPVTGIGVSRAVVLTAADVLALGDGPVSVSATQTDVAGNASGPSLPLEFTLDTTAPAAPTIATVYDDVLQVTGFINNGGTTNDVSPTLSGVADPGTVITLRDGSAVVGTATADDFGRWSVTTSPLPQGLRTLTASSQDVAGNVSIASLPRTLTVDTLAPIAPQITSIESDVPPGPALIANGGWTNDRTLLVRGTTEPNARVTFWIDYGTSQAQPVVVRADSNGLWSVAAGSLGDGQHTFSALVRDAASNKSPLSPASTVMVDATAPELLAVSSPLAAGTYTTGSQIDIHIQFSEPVTVVGTPTLALNTTPARVATFVRSSGATMIFQYVPSPGDASAQLDYISTAALSLSGGSIRDQAGNDANIALPTPGSSRSLISEAIAVDATLKVTAVGLSTKPSSAPAITTRKTSIPLTFSSPVTGVTLSAIKLFYQNRSVSLAGASISGSGTTYTLLIPGTATSLKGLYRLQVGGVGSGISDAWTSMDTPISLYWRRV